MSFADLFSGHAGAYRAFRPTYPPELFTYLASLTASHDRAWDCATGNGQAAVALKPLFREVIATDPSAEQLAAAPRIHGVVYAVAPAEQTSIAAESVDLVTVAQALHWFDFDRFYAEARRVAKPSAAIACWCYELMAISPAVDALVFELYQPILGAYWSPRRRLVEERYATVPFPFRESSPPAFAMRHAWTLAQVVGYLRTWSALQEYQRQKGADPLQMVGERLIEAWGEPNTPRDVTWPLTLRIGFFDL